MVVNNFFFPGPTTQVGIGRPARITPGRLMDTRSATSARLRGRNRIAVLVPDGVCSWKIPAVCPMSICPQIAGSLQWSSPKTTTFYWTTLRDTEAEPVIVDPDMVSAMTRSRRGLDIKAFIGEQVEFNAAQVRAVVNHKAIGDKAVMGADMVTS